MQKQLQNLLLDDGDFNAQKEAVDLGNGTPHTEQRNRSHTATWRHPLSEAECQGSPFKMMPHTEEPWLLSKRGQSSGAQPS